MQKMLKFKNKFFDSSGLTTCISIIVAACFVMSSVVSAISTFASTNNGMVLSGPSSWPSSWTLIDTDPDENGWQDNYRDVEYAYYNFDNEYLYLRLYCYGTPLFDSNGGESRFKWFIDLDGDAYFSGQNIFGGEYLLFVEDTPKPGGDDIGDVYFLNDTDGDGKFSEWEAPPDYYSGGLITDSNIAGYRIVDKNVDLYIRLANISNPSATYLVWATDQENSNLEQGPKTDTTDIPDIPIGPVPLTDIPCINVIKTVWNESSSSWDDGITATVGTNLTFKIIVINTGNITLHDVVVTDYLPSILEYRDATNYTPSSASAHQVTWTFPSLDVGNTVEITFHAEIVSTGFGDNVANVTTCESVSDEDAAHIIGEGAPQNCIVFFQPLSNVDGDTSMWSTSDSMVVLPGAGHWDLLDGTADVDGYINGQGILTHRGTRGLGINGYENDEVDSYDRPERIEITFDKPRALLYLEVRSLFDNEGPSGAPEEGDIDLYLDGSFISNYHLYGIEDLHASGTIGRVNITLPASTFVDRIVFYVQQGQDFTPYSEFAVAKLCVGPEEPAEPSVDIVKDVWDEKSGSWNTEVRVPVGTDLTFRIIVTNNGSTDLTDVTIVDWLSYQLEYRNLANITPDFESPHEIIWHFPLLTSGEQREIIYHAETVHICYGSNLVKVTASESVCDTAIVMVKVNESGQAVADVTMQVWDEGISQWTDSINQDIGASLLFKITVNNTALHNLHNFIVTDTFPPQLVYSNDASYPPSSSSPDTVIWQIDEMAPGEVIEITYHAETVWTGVGDTSVNLITDEQYYDEDSVLIKVFNAAPEADAHGPYEGDIDIPISFRGSVSSGKTPYKWYWSFGDNTYSNDQNPNYRYRQPGNYTVSLSVTDSIGRRDTDRTYVVIHPVEELVVDAGGPYEGKVDEAIQFYGNAIGGIPLYSWFWEFGDGGVSWEQNPTYGYDTPGEHTATLSVTDAHGKTDDDNVKVIVTTMDNTPPTIQIAKPVKALYLGNKEIINFPVALILGNIDIKVSATDQHGGSGMNKVEFYIEGSLKYTAASTPYNWTWDEKAFGKKTIEVIAYDTAGNSATDKLDAWILNI